MKYLIAFLFTGLFFACHKQGVAPAPTAATYLPALQSFLKDSLPASDYESLDFGRVIRATPDSGKTWWVRVPFTGRPMTSGFVLAQINQAGLPQKGRIVSLAIDMLANGQIDTRLNGHITVQSLQRANLIYSSLHKGYIMALHPLLLPPAGADVVPQPYDVLPEVVVTGYYNTSTDYYLSAWISLDVLWGVDGGGTGTGGTAMGYTPLDPSNGDGNESLGGGGTAGAGGGSAVIELEPDWLSGQPSVNIVKFFKCFDAVPSVGATYTVKLCSDIPVNSDPSIVTNGLAGFSPGHSFLVVTKSNGSASVTQAFGFYPGGSYSILDPLAPVASEIKDNGNSEINASIEVSVSESQFNLLKQSVIAFSSKQYDLLNFNCTDYALNAFNAMGAYPISLPAAHVSLPTTLDPLNLSAGFFPVTINKMPQTLFVFLQGLKNANAAIPGNIVIEQSHNYKAPISHGECN